MSPLTNYHNLLEKVDQLCNGITSILGDAIVCHAGCSSCCLAISVFPVEAFSIVNVINKMPPAKQQQIRKQLQTGSHTDKCPLLSDERCLIYETRPIICRTHGLPILITDNDEQRMDVCPLNCRGIEQIPGNAVIDIEKLNTMLATINALYLKETGGSITERIEIKLLFEILKTI